MDDQNKVPWVARVRPAPDDTPQGAELVNPHGECIQLVRWLTPTRFEAVHKDGRRFALHCDDWRIGKLNPAIETEALAQPQERSDTLPIINHRMAALIEDATRKPVAALMAYVVFGDAQPTVEGWRFQLTVDQLTSILDAVMLMGLRIPR